MKTANEPKFKVKSKVKVTGKVLVREKDNEMKPKNLRSEIGVVKKIDRDEHYYVKTKYGVHYLHGSKIRDAED